MARTQYKYFEQSEGYVSSLISALVSEDWVTVVNNCDVKSWKEALTAVLTHASDEDLPSLCGKKYIITITYILRVLLNKFIFTTTFYTYDIIFYKK